MLVNYQVNLRDDNPNFVENAKTLADIMTSEVLKHPIFNNELKDSVSEFLLIPGIFYTASEDKAYLLMGVMQDILNKYSDTYWSKLIHVFASKGSELETMLR